MSIENDGSDIRLICDECGEMTRAWHRTEFDEMVHHAKLRGWQIIAKKGQYFHRCPDCIDEMAAFGLDDDE